MPAEPKATLEKMLQLLGFAVTVEEHRMEEGVLLDVNTDDSGRLIGRQGQTLSDLQAAGSAVLLLRDNPTLYHPVGTCLARTDWRGLSPGECVNTSPSSSGCPQRTTSFCLI